MVAGRRQSWRSTPNHADSIIDSVGFVTPAYADKSIYRFCCVITGFAVLLTSFAGSYTHKLVAGSFPKTLFGQERFVYSVFGDASGNAEGIVYTLLYYSVGVSISIGYASGNHDGVDHALPHDSTGVPTYCAALGCGTEASSGPAFTTAD